MNLLTVADGQVGGHGGQEERQDKLLKANGITGVTLRWPKKSSKEMLTREGTCMKS